MLTHPWYEGLFADPEGDAILAPKAELARYRDIECAWTLAQADIGIADRSVCDQAARHIRDCVIDDDILRAGVAQDGIPIPAFVRALKAEAPEPVRGVLHVGLTSQDVMDTSLVLSLGPIFDLYRARLAELKETLNGLAEKNAGRPLMGYTRMQAALPITADARIATWVRPIGDYIPELDQLEGRVVALQWGGPVGVRNGAHADSLGPAFAARLGLRDPGEAWHTTRANIAEVGAFVARLTGSLGKMGQDIALMAQRGPADITLATGGTSSAMPHKQNPILAELLVTVAHYSAQQATLLNLAMVHEQERSGTTWMLELMTLPDLLHLGGRSLKVAQTLAGQIRSIGADPA